MRYLIVADPHGETVLCSGEDRGMGILAHRIRQERLFRYVRLSDRLPSLQQGESACADAECTSPVHVNN